MGLLAGKLDLKMPIMGYKSIHQYIVRLPDCHLGKPGHHYYLLWDLREFMWIYVDNDNFEAMYLMFIYVRKMVKTLIISSFE